ncbi:uncharacterized protein [Anoplolepis gracilipes]|uniref:uncharacterized protein isoform X2 n=1 Tax=Anoplolepis gracilipes TaxID=354296 RepID=UPI003BA318EA
MINIEYFNLNKFLLLLIGLWPYKQSHFTRFQFIFLSSILTTNVIFQCTTFISHKCTIELIIKVLASTFFFTIFVIKYNLFYVKIENMKVLLDQLLHVYNEIKDKNEIAIMNECGYNCKRYTVVLTVIGVCSMFAIMIASTWSNILLTNSSPSYHLMIATEYFIDQEKYYYFILFHFFITICIGNAVMLGIGTILIVYFAHTIGLFKIASYRIERSMDIDMLRNINKENTLIYKGLICAVNIHLQAMNLSSNLLSNFETMMVCLLVFTVGSVSFNLFRIISSEENIGDLICPLLFATFTILYMFIANYIGQSIMNHNHGIFTTAYNVRWYVAPLYIQRMILFLLQRSSVDYVLKIGGLFVASIEWFASLIKTSVSYFTVIYSTQ